ncbi:MAG: lysophospholipid acyltransferase family protein [bacterium]
MLFKLIHTLMFYFVAVASFIVGTLLTIPFAIAAREHHKPFQLSARAWAKMLMLISGARTTVSGLDNIPKDGGLIFASNHQGAFDILIHLAYLPRYFRFVAKSELFKIPFFGWYMSLAGYVPIEREVSASAHRTIGSVADVLSKGDCILMFPEGTRSKTGELGPFKRGSLMAAFSSGAAVVPVAISGSYKMMPKKTYLINVVPVEIKFGRPISFKKYFGIKPTKDDYERELTRLREEIQKLLD